MKDQLKVLKAENKGKGTTKASTAADELNYLVDFNSSITQAAAKSMEHLSESIFITMGNLTLVRRDAYLSHLRTGIKPDTLTALRSAPFTSQLCFQTQLLCQLTCQSAGIMSSLCGVGVRVRVRVNNFSSKTTRPRDVLFFLKDTLSIEDEKLFKACKSVCSSVC